MSEVSEKAVPGPFHVRVGGGVYPVSDPLNIQPVAADIVVFANEISGVVRLDFGTAVVMPTIEDKVHVEFQVCARLRLSLTDALVLKNILDGLLSKTVPAKHEVN